MGNYRYTNRNSMHLVRQAAIQPAGQLDCRKIEASIDFIKNITR